jgi:hypothetical protein
MFRVDKFGEKYLVHSLCKVVLIGENDLEKFMSNIFKKQLEKNLFTQWLYVGKWDKNLTFIVVEK